MDFWESFEYKGKWWRPSEPDKIVAGILTKIDDKITLELIGSFSDEETPLENFLNKKDESIIHGITTEAKNITLLNCSAYGSYNLSCPFPEIKYSCQIVVIGKHINSLEEKAHYWAQFKYPVLSEWCPPQNFETQFLIGNNNNAERVSISFDCEPNVLSNNSIDNQTTLLLKSRVEYKGNYLTPKLRQETYLEIKKNKETSISELLSINYQYRQLLSFVCLQDVAFTEATFFDKDTCQKTKNGNLHYFPTVVICSWWCREITKDKANWQFLFSFDDIKKDYQTILENWYKDFEKIAPIRGHLIDSVKSSSIFSSVVFLTVIQAIDGFYCRYRKDISKLKPKLEALLEEFKDVTAVCLNSIDIKCTIDSRNYYSHLLPKGKKTHVLYGIELYNLTNKLRKLLVCCILSLIGIGHDSINEFLNKTNNHYIR